MLFARGIAFRHRAVALPAATGPLLLRQRELITAEATESKHIPPQTHPSTRLPFEWRQDQQEALRLNKDQPPVDSSGLSFEFAGSFFIHFFANKVI